MTQFQFTSPLRVQLEQGKVEALVRKTTRLTGLAENMANALAGLGR